MARLRRATVELSVADALRIGRAIREAGDGGRPARAFAEELQQAFGFESVEAMAETARRRRAKERNRRENRARIVDALDQGRHLERWADVYGFESVDEMAAWAARRRR